MPDRTPSSMRTPGFIQRENSPFLKGPEVPVPVAPAAAPPSWIPTPSRSSLRPWAAYRRGVKRGSDPAFLQAPPNPWQHPSTWTVHATTRPWPRALPRRGHVFTPILPQAPPNSWQHPSTWVVKARTRAWIWMQRRGRQLVPNPPQLEAPLAIRSPVQGRRRAWLRIIRHARFDIPWYQAAPNSWQVVSTWTVHARDRVWRWRRYPRLFNAPFPQAPPNAWQVVSTWVMRGRARWTWRRPRMHDEPALMPQQAANPNPVIVEFFRTVHRQWRSPRRALLFNAPFPQAPPNAWQVVATWIVHARDRVWRRRPPQGRIFTPTLPQAPPNAWQVASTWVVRGGRRWSWRRARMHDEPALMPAPSPGMAEFTRSPRRRWNWRQMRGKLIAPTPPQVAAAPPAFVNWVTTRPRHWRVTRRASAFFRQIPQVPSSPILITMIEQARTFTMTSAARAMTMIEQVRTLTMTSATRVLTMIEQVRNTISKGQ